MENNNPPDENDLTKKFNEEFGNQNPQNNPNFNQQNPNFNQQNPNFNQQNPYNNPQGGYQQPFNNPQGFIQPLPQVPGGVAGMVLGIIGLFLSIIWCYWIAAGVGLILSIIALVVSNKALRQAAEAPGVYSESSIGNAKAGKILGIIGLVISIIEFLILFIVIFFVASVGANAFRL